MAATVQASLAAGEIGPPLWGRTDLAWQSSAAREIENFIPTPHGPVKFRGGRRFIAEVDDSADLHRLIPFRFSVDDAYMLIFGDQSIRFGREKGIITLSGAPVTLNAGSGVIWPSSALASLRYTQSFDVLFLFCTGFKPQQLARASHTSWSLAAFAYRDGPWYPENTTDTTFTASAAGPTGVTITASAVTGINNNTGFQTTDIGRHLRFYTTSAGTGPFMRWGKITARTSTTVVTVDFDGTDPLASLTATKRWRLGLWSDTTGYPISVAMHEGRLATVTKPQWALPRVDLSMSGALDTFSPSKHEQETKSDIVSDDCAIAVNLAGGELNTPFDLHSARDLIVFTAGKEFRVNSGSLTEPITPVNAKVTGVSAYGAAPGSDVLELHNKIAFTQRDKRTLRILQYDIAQEGYSAKDETVRAPEIGRAGRADASGGFSELAWCQSPNYLLHAVRGDGVMPTLTYLPEQEVEAWARHRAAPTAAADAAIESVASIPYLGVDQLWLVTKYTIGGATKRYVEILEEPLGADDPIEDAFYVDCGLTLDNSGTFLGYGTLTPGAGATVAGTTGVTFTASTGGFTSGHVGQRLLYRYLDTVNYRAGRHPRHKHLVWKTASALITARNSATVVVATIEAAFPSTSAIAAADWRLTVSSVSGLSHLNGESVQVWGDGAPQTAKTVSAGAITLDTPAATVHAGLFAGGTIEPIVQLEGPARQRPNKARISHVKLYLYRTLGGRVRVYGRDDAETYNDELILNRSASDPVGQAPTEFSGWTEKIPVPDGWDENPTLLIQQDVPGPMTIRAIAPVFEGSAS